MARTGIMLVAVTCLVLGGCGSDKPTVRRLDQIKAAFLKDDPILSDDGATGWAETSQQLCKQDIADWDDHGALERQWYAAQRISDYTESVDSNFDPASAIAETRRWMSFGCPGVWNRYADWMAKNGLST